MKRIYILVMTTCMAIVSCSEDNVGRMYEETGKGGFAFGAPVLNVETIPEDGNEILVPVYRSNASINLAEISFKYDIAGATASDPDWQDADPDALFSLTSQRVIFPDNVYMAYAHIRYTDINALNPTGKYRFKLIITNDTTPSNRKEVIVTVGRKLTFELLGKCLFHDTCFFENAYETEIYKAKEGGIYRVTDPYTPGLLAEEYAAEGWMQNPPEYVQFICDEDGKITFEPFKTGMLINGKYMAWAYYPSEYQWGKDFSEFNKENKKISDTEFQLYPVYCLPDYQYGFLNDGAYALTITLK